MKFLLEPRAPTTGIASGVWSRIAPAAKPAQPITCSCCTQFTKCKSGLTPLCFQNKGKWMFHLMQELSLSTNSSTGDLQIFNSLLKVQYKPSKFNVKFASHWISQCHHGRINHPRLRDALCVYFNRTFGQHSHLAQRITYGAIHKQLLLKLL